MSLFFVTVAASGDRKSTADNEALWPVRKYEQSLKAKHDVERLNYAILHAAFNAERKKVEGDRQLDYEARKVALDNLWPEPEKPLYPFLTMPEPPFEELVKAWPTAPAALGIFAAEGGQFIGGQARE